MNLTKCSKGHYYDGDKYSSCPFCSGAGAGPAADSVTVAAGPGSSDVTVSLGSASAANDPVTVMSSNHAASSDPVTQKSYQTGVTGDYTPQMDNFSNIPGTNPFPDDDVVTQSHYQPIMDNFVEEPVSAEPVVGWLVCISGRYFGQSFPLKAGRNFVGRSPQMDVCLGGENSVSRERHAVIIYEPRGRMFLAQPGDSRELFYLNDKVVLDNEKLNPYDILSIGKVDMMLIPFCTEKFAWEDLEKQKEEKKKKKEEMKDKKKKDAGISLSKETEESK